MKLLSFIIKVLTLDVQFAAAATVPFAILSVRSLRPFIVGMHFIVLESSSPRVPWSWVDLLQAVVPFVVIAFAFIFVALLAFAVG